MSNYDPTTFEDLHGDLIKAADSSCQSLMDYDPEMLVQFLDDFGEDVEADIIRAWCDEVHNRGLDYEEIAAC